MVKKEVGPSKEAGAARGAGKGGRRLKGIINSVLRRRINDCEKELRPSVLKYLDSRPSEHDVIFPVQQRLLAPAANDVPAPTRAISAASNTTALISALTPCAHRTVSDPGAHREWDRWSGTQNWALWRCASDGAGSTDHMHAFRAAPVGYSEDSSSSCCRADFHVAVQAYTAVREHDFDRLPQVYGVSPIAAMPFETVAPSGTSKSTSAVKVEQHGATVVTTMSKGVELASHNFAAHSADRPLHGVSPPELEHERSSSFDHGGNRWCNSWMDHYAREVGRA
jgi:hypothetical protein